MHKWRPKPKPICRPTSGREKSSRSGSVHRAGSRSAATSRDQTISPSLKAVPASFVSCLTMRGTACGTPHHRRTSSIAFGPGSQPPAAVGPGAVRTQRGSCRSVSQSCRWWVISRSSSAQTSVRQLVSPGKRPIPLVRRLTSPSDRSSRFVDRHRRQWRWRWKTCGREWRAVVKKRTAPSQGCPECGRRKAAEFAARVGRWRQPREGSVGVLHPELLAEWHPRRNDGLDPVAVGPDRPLVLKVC